MMKKITNTIYALYQTLVLIEIIQEHDLMSTQNMIWLGMGIFTSALFTMPRIMKNKYSVSVFLCSVLVFGGGEIFEYSLFTLTLIWGIDKLISKNLMNRNIHCEKNIRNEEFEGENKDDDDDDDDDITNIHYRYLPYNIWHKSGHY